LFDLFDNIRHIFFDLDDTLWDLKKNAREGLLQSIEICHLKERIKDPETFISQYLYFNKLAWEAYHRNQVSMERLRIVRFEWLLEQWGIFDKEVVRKLSGTYMQVTPSCPHLVEGAKEMLEFLSEKKYTLHILTNGFPDVQPVKLRSGKIEKFFSNVFISDEIGYRKPQPELYAFVMQRIKARSEECLMIGDQYLTDIAGAREAGWQALWFNRENSKRYTYHPQVITLKDICSFF